jgi:hypothetical protein
MIFFRFFLLFQFCFLEWAENLEFDSIVDAQMNKPKLQIGNPDYPPLCLLLRFTSFLVHLLNPFLAVHVGWASANQQNWSEVPVPFSDHYQLLIGSGILGSRFLDVFKESETN